LIDEVGTALNRRYAEVDPLFTPAGFAAYADDLLARIVNPYLRDTTARVGRDPERKLGWDDRLIGSMRMAHATGVMPARYAFGAAAALHVLDPAADPAVTLPALWRQASPPAGEAAAMLAYILRGMRRLTAWQAAGCPNLAEWWTQDGAKHLA
jgi:mannitol-1-phosphate 5-dehydrogenase